MRLLVEQQDNYKLLSHVHGVTQPVTHLNAMLSHRVPVHAGVSFANADSVLPGVDRVSHGDPGIQSQLLRPA